jgi:hypothetical protein
LWHNIQARAYNYLLLLTTWIQYGYMDPHARGNILGHFDRPKKGRITRTRAGQYTYPEISEALKKHHPHTRGAILTTSLPWGNEVISTEGIHRLIMTCYQVEYGPVKRTTPRIGRKGRF